MPANAVALNYKQSLRRLREQFGFDFVSLAMVYGVNRPLLTWKYATASLGGEYQRIVLPPGKGIAGRVYQTGQGMVVQNASEELAPDGMTEYSIAISEQLESFLALPLWQEDRVAAVLLMAFRTPNQVTPELFGNILTDLCAGFCDFITKPTGYEALLRRVGRGAAVAHEPVYAMLTDHVIKAQEEERQRISRELHDSIVQELLGVQMLLRMAKGQPEREALLQSMQSADDALGEIQQQLRDLAVSLRPVTLDDLGLVAAFRSHFEAIEHRYGKRVLLHENVGSMRFELLLETVFYRVCQEAVHNACKYAGCGEILVSLTLVGDTLLLEVADCGCGFTASSPEVLGTGLGLRGMAERAEMIDGEFTVHSTPGEGTTLRLSAAVLQ